MPIIAKVGRRTWSTRLLLGSIYAVLILGGASMVYPFLLMFATSTTGEPEIAQYRIIPRYWFDRTALYQRFVQEKYQNVADFTPLHTAVQAPADSVGEVHIWRDIAMPSQTQQTKNAAQLWRTFCAALPTSSFDLWYIGRRNMPGKSELLWRDYLKTRYAAPADLGRAFGREISSFTEVFAPYEKTEGRLWPGVEGVEGADWDAFKKSLDPEYRRPVDGVVQWRGYLHQRYEQIAQFNRMAGTTYTDFTDIPLPRRSPAGPLAADWEAWVRTQLGFRFIQIDDGDRLYAGFLVSTFGSLNAADAQLQTKYSHDHSIAWPPANPTTAELDAIDNFLRNHQPISVFSVSTPDVQYQDFLASKFGVDVPAYNAQTGERIKSFAEVRPPYAQEDIAAFDASAGAWRWWALTRNYAEVIDYIAIRGRSLWNTLFLCGSLVLASVTVNPLAAYALSRFRLSLTNQILTFLLATMAFPGEVTMIPNFSPAPAFPGLVVGCGVDRGGGRLLCVSSQAGKQHLAMDHRAHARHAGRRFQCAVSRAGYRPSA
jgi:ABC-type glycerol-3-phosphate transport system permease component